MPPASASATTLNLGLEFCAMLGGEKPRTTATITHKQRGAGKHETSLDNDIGLEFRLKTQSIQNKPGIDAAIFFAAGACFVGPFITFCRASHAHCTPHLVINHYNVAHNETSPWAEESHPAAGPGSGPMLLQESENALP